MVYLQRVHKPTQGNWLRWLDFVFETVFFQDSPMVIKSEYDDGMLSKLSKLFSSNLEDMKSRYLALEVLAVSLLSYYFLLLPLTTLIGII